MNIFVVYQKREKKGGIRGFRLIFGKNGHKTNVLHKIGA